MALPTPTSRISLNISISIVIALFGVVLIFLSHARSQELARRLILKDGSYQTITKYEIKGDRVRYLSAERDEWEELPTALVDWPATEKYEKERAAAPAIPEAAAIDKEFKEGREAELSRLPQVAPGLRLPEDSGVFLLDNFQGQPQLVEMQQAEGDIKSNTKGNILRGALNPVASSKQSVELDGEHATIRAHITTPSIYINVDEQAATNSNGAPPPGETDSAKPSQPSLDAPRSQPQGPVQPQQPVQPMVPFDRFRIVKVQVKGGHRVLGGFKRSVNGKISQEQNAMKTSIDNLKGGWLKLTPIEALAPGEYALIESKSGEGMNLYVWDFAVNPGAPANANPWKPSN
jgi:hypothetical protein